MPSWRSRSARGRRSWREPVSRPPTPASPHRTDVRRSAGTPPAPRGSVRPAAPRRRGTACGGLVDEQRRRVRRRCLGAGHVDPGRRVALGRLCPRLGADEQQRAHLARAGDGELDEGVRLVAGPTVGRSRATICAGRDCSRSTRRASRASRSEWELTACGIRADRFSGKNQTSSV